MIIMLTNIISVGGKLYAVSQYESGSFIELYLQSLWIMDKSFDIASIKTLLNGKGNLNHFEENIKMTTCLHQEQYSLKLQSKPFLYRNHCGPQDVSRDLRCLHTVYYFKFDPTLLPKIDPDFMMST